MISSEKRKRLIKRFLLMLQRNHMPAGWRNKLLRTAGMHISPKSLIRSGIDFEIADAIVGDNSFIGKNCVFYSSVRFPSAVYIGDNVKIAPEVMFCCVSHEIGESELRAGDTYNKDITIGDGCWIGTRTVLLPGVSVGRGSIVAAGAVVTKDIPPNTLVGGGYQRKSFVICEK